MLSELVRQLSEDASTALSSMHRPPHTKSDNSSATKSDNPSATKMQSYSAGNKTCVVQSAYDSGVATPIPVGTPCTVDTAVLNRQLAIARDTIERYERNRAVIQSTVQLAGEECRKKKQDHSGKGQDHSGKGQDHNGQGRGHNGQGQDDKGKGQDHREKREED